MLESNKRLLCSMFIYSNLLVVAFDIPPVFGIVQDLEIPLLAEEALWNAPTAEAWRTLRDARPPAPPQTIRNVMAEMLTGENGDFPGQCAISGFTALMTIHAVNILAWNLSQFSQLPILLSMDSCGNAAHALLSNTLKTLARCQDVLRRAKPEGIESLWSTSEGALLLNCEAMLRVAYTRIFLNVHLPERLVLLFSTSRTKSDLLKRFVASEQYRDPVVTKIMANMCDAFSVPFKAGYLLVQKTAAISWSVEHAMAGWGCGRFLALY